MAQVVAFQTFAPRIARQRKTVTRANGDKAFGKVIVFTGVWHERVDEPDPPVTEKKASKPRK